MTRLINRITRNLWWTMRIHQLPTATRSGSWSKYGVSWS